MNKITIYPKSTYIYVFNWIMLISFGLFGLILIIGIVYEPDSFICLSIMLVMILIILYGNINLYPTLGIAESHLRVYSLWGSYKQIPWENIIEIRPPTLPWFPSFYRHKSLRGLIIKVKNIGLINRFYGLVYDNGGQIILISPWIPHYHEFIDDLHKHCPQAFKKYPMYS